MRGQLSPPPAGWLYLIALGSNRRHHRHGDPRRTLSAALAELAGSVSVRACSPTLSSAPLGPSRRRYANAAAVVATPLSPPDLLALLKRAEHRFGRRRGQRWGARVLDLDIILWQGGAWEDRRPRGLRIPHPHYHLRDFVLVPASRIAADWRDPRRNLSLAQIASRLRRAAAYPPRGLDRRSPAP